MLLLNFLQLKVIFMSKRHALRWHILISFSGFRFWERNQNANNLFRVTNAEAKDTEPVSCLKRTWSKEMDSQESCYQNCPGIQAALRLKTSRIKVFPKGDKNVTKDIKNMLEFPWIMPETVFKALLSLTVRYFVKNEFKAWFMFFGRAY